MHSFAIRVLKRIASLELRASVRHAEVKSRRSVFCSGPLDLSAQVQIERAAYQTHSISGREDAHLAFRYGQDARLVSGFGAVMRTQVSVRRYRRVQRSRTSPLGRRDIKGTG